MAKYTILIIEDEAPLREILKEKFKEEKFNVLIGRNGEEGLAMALKNKIDIILLDIIMPRMDGFTMLEKLRKTKEGKNIPVILLTNLSSPEDVSKALEEGAFDYLVKTDWKLDEVVAKVRHKLKI